jgi:hypothetical protein
MKRVLYIFVAVAVFVSCGRKHKSKPDEKKQARIEIVPFYKNKVYLQDLHLIDTSQFLVEPEEFLTDEQYAKFTKAMWTLIRDPKGKAFPGSMSATKAYSATELKTRFVTCDSVVQVDENDQPIGKPFLSCDSTSRMNNLAVIYFYESWYLNTKTNLIEKETLGYSVWNYVKEKEAFREMFTVFRDEEAARKCELYEFYE